VVQALVHYQAESGHRVTVLTTDQGARNGEQPVELSAAVTVERFSVHGPDRIAYAPRFTRVVKERLRASDVVHVHSVFLYPVHVALREALAAGVPVVLRPCGHLHRYSLRRSRWRKRLYLALWGGMVRRACSAWHYTSENEAAESWPWDSSPRFVLPNGVEPAAYALDPGEAREALRRHWPELRDSPYVLFLGRLHPKKRLDLLLAAFLAGAPGPFKLVVAGPDECSLWGPLAARFLRDPAAAGRVLRIEMVSGARKAALLAGASLFALPSEHENFGVAALEALAAGTPVLLSPHVDLADAVVAAGLGETVPLEVGAWTEQLAALLGNTGGLSEAAERRRRWVKEQYSWSQIARKLVQRYRWVMAGCPTGPP
jgi:glycosyltransferase involved in cell wall biosynthesis